MAARVSYPVEVKIKAIEMMLVGIKVKVAMEELNGSGWRSVRRIGRRIEGNNICPNHLRAYGRRAFHVFPLENNINETVEKEERDQAIGWLCAANKFRYGFQKRSPLYSQELVTRQFSVSCKNISGRAVSKLRNGNEPDNLHTLPKISWIAIFTQQLRFRSSPRISRDCLSASRSCIFQVS